MTEAIVNQFEAIDEPDEAVQAEVARNKNNLSNMLRDLGHREDTLEAVEEAVRLYRRLVSERADAFTPNLATSLNNLANGLSDLGRREDALEAAEEAVSLRRRLASDRTRLRLISETR